MEEDRHRTYVPTSPVHGTHFDIPNDYQTPITLSDLRNRSQSDSNGSEHYVSPYNPSPYSPPHEKPGWVEVERRAASTAPEVVEMGLHQMQPVRGHHRALSPAFSSQSTTVEYPMTPPKPVFYADGLQVRQSYFNEGKEVSDSYQLPQGPPKQRKRLCGCSIWLFFALLVIIVVIAAALGAGLGVGLTHKKDSSNGTSNYTGDPRLAIGGVLNPAYYSKTGAMNGTGIAFAGESFVQGEHDIFTVYFQHYEGDIRWMRLNAQGQYEGGRLSETVATDAKNSTPISVVAYAMNSTAKTHLFYIGNDGFIKQKSYFNTSNIWLDGPVTDLKLKAFNADSVGLQACYYGNFYGDSDASKFPTANGATNQQAYDIGQGMHLWYASDAQTFQQYGIYEGQQQWVFQQEWPGFNGHAGVGCYSWLPGTVTYAMLVNLNDTVEIYWKDTNTTLTSNATHPINEWTKAPNASIPDVYPSTSLGYTTYFYAQLQNTEIQGYNISFNSENTQLLNSIIVSDTSGPVDVLGGTHMSVSAVANPSGGASLYVFAQDQGNDISVYTRDLTGGQWSSGKLPIPDQ